MGWDNFDDDIKRKAEELFKNPKLRIIFDAKEIVKPEDIDFVYNYLLFKMKEVEANKIK